MANTPPVYPEHLKRIPPFSAFREDERAALQSVVHRRTCAPNVQIARARRGAHGVYAIVSGRAKFVMQDLHGRQVILAVLHPGDFFCESELDGGTTGETAAVALDRCELLFAPGPVFAAVARESCAVAHLMSNALAARLRDAYRTIADLAFRGVRARVSRLLAARARYTEGAWVVHDGAEEIARTVAASREMVSRVMREMRENGMIVKRGRRIVVLDRGSLLADVDGTAGIKRERHDPHQPVEASRRSILMHLLAAKEDT